MFRFRGSIPSLELSIVSMLCFNFVFGLFFFQSSLNFINQQSKKGIFLSLGV